MTPRQAELYRFVRETIERTGQAPTYAEMTSALKCEQGNIHRLLSSLVERGHLVHVPLMKRGLRLATQPSRPLVATAFRVEDGKIVSRYFLTEAGWAEK